MDPRDSLADLRILERSEPSRFRIGIMLENIDYWRDAPVWEPESIARATREWFSHLGE